MNPTVTYDLSTADGFAKAANDYAEQNPGKAFGLFGLAAIFFPAPIVFAAAGKALSTAFSRLFKDSEDVIKAQRQAAVDIIKAGKANGVKKMKVTLDQKAGVDIGSELSGIPLKCAFGSDSTMTIEVEY